MGAFYSHHFKPHVATEYPVDPIVFPGIVGDSEWHPDHQHHHGSGPHKHDFAGRLGINENSTTADLLDRLSSGKEKVGATYWTPSLYVNGQHVIPDDFAARYGTGLAGNKNPDRFIPFPPGMGLVSTRSPKYAVWNLENPGKLNVKSWNVIPRHDLKETVCTITFPDWWSGRDPGIPNWTLECGYSINGTIPDGAWALPQLKLIVHYGKLPVINEAHLSSGPPNTMHADFFNTWDEGRLRKAFDYFLVQDNMTGEVGTAKALRD